MIAAQVYVMFACSVCGSVSPAARTAYAGTTVFLSLLPLLFIGLVVLYVRSEILAQGSAKRPLRNESIGGEYEGGASAQDSARRHAPGEAPFAEEQGTTEGSG